MLYLELSIVVLLLIVCYMYFCIAFNACLHDLHTVFLVFEAQVIEFWSLDTYCEIIGTDIISVAPVQVLDSL